MNTKFKNILFAFALGLIALPIMGGQALNVSATENTPALVNADVQDSPVPINSSDLIDERKEVEASDGTEYIDTNTSMDEAITHLEGKAFDVVKLLQVVGKPIIVVFFIVSLILSGAGAFGQSQYMFKGLIGMILCGIAYTGIMFSPQIIQFFSSWLST